MPDRAALHFIRATAMAGKKRGATYDGDNKIQNNIERAQWMTKSIHPNMDVPSTS